MKHLLLLFLLLTLSATANAKPHVLTKRFAAAVVAAGLATAADVEATAYCVKLPACVESNSGVYGTRPSRAKLYAINVPVTALLVLVSGAMKRDGFDKSWWVPLAPVAVIHGYAAVHGIGVIHHAERLCPSGTLCTFR